MADKEDEHRLLEQLGGRFDAYAAAWDQARAAGQSGEEAGLVAAAALRSDTLSACQELREFNTREIETSEMEHRRTVRWLSWGLVGVGVVGSLAGAFLGYSVTRGLRRSLHRLSIRVQDAAGMLGQRQKKSELVARELPRFTV